MTKKTETLACELKATEITFQHKVRNGDDWEVKTELNLKLEDFPEVLQNGEGTVSFAAYGLRALLLDRTSQLRTLGVAGVLKGMPDHIQAFKDGKYKANKATGKAVDMLWAEALAFVKDISVGAAVGAIKALKAEDLEKLKSNAKVKAAYNSLADKQKQDVSLDDLLS